MVDVTQLLARIETGDSQAANELFPLIYDELRRMANWQLASQKPGQTLQPTALVNEAYIRLAGPNPCRKFSSREGFFAAASQAMRHILVDIARRKLAIKRGGDHSRADIDLDNVEVHRPAEILSVHEALSALEVHDPKAAQIVKLHYFSGLSLAEIAEIQNVSRATVHRYWVYAKTWLRAAIEDAN